MCANSLYVESLEVLVSFVVAYACKAVANVHAWMPRRPRDATYYAS